MRISLFSLSLASLEGGAMYDDDEQKNKKEKDRERAWSRAYSYSDGGIRL